MNATLCACCVTIFCGAQAALAATFLEGTVTDEQGRPVAGASVTILDCIGTCLGGKTVLSDEDGHYVFEQKSFRNSPSLRVFMPGRYEVSRQQSGPALYEPETDVQRRADFVIGTPAAAGIRLEGDPPDGWTQSLSIRAGRDVVLHRYDVTADKSSGWEPWNIDVLPRNEGLHLVVSREPEIEEGLSEEEAKQRRQENWRKKIEIISPAIRLVDPQRYIVRATVMTDADTGNAWIRIDQVTDAVGADRTQELLSADPQFGPPAEAALQEQAHALLKRVAAAAAPWNARPPKSIASYEYDAVGSSGEPTHVRIDQNTPAGPAWGDISRLRGFAYMPPLRWLFSQPENVVFHGVEIGEERAVLRYRLKEGRGFSAGMGIGPWNGFFSRGFSAGTVIIDPRTATVVEHRLSAGPLGEESVETFADYVAIGDGFAPKSLRIESEGFDFRLKFQIHGDKLWLLEEGRRDDEAQPSFKITNVVVQSAP